MKIPLFDLRVNDKNLKKKLLNSINKTLTHGRLFLGPEVQLLEKKLSKILKRKYVICLSSGSSALYLSLKSLGIKKGDEVITTPLSWIITSNAIIETGATPIFVNVDENLTIDPYEIEKKINKKTKAIVPMHYAGKLCQMEQIKKIAKKNKLFVVEDCAQAFGAQISNKESGSFSDVAAYSLNPMKPLGGYGEGGFITTNSKIIFNKIKILRHAGTLSDPNKIITNYCVEPSLNHKMDSINASLTLVALKYYKKNRDKKNKIFNFYNKNLSNIIIRQQIKKNEVHGMYVYAIRIRKNRNNLKKYLEKNGIETKIFNEPLICDSPGYKKYNKNKLKKTRKKLNEILIIPSHEKLNSKDVKFIVEKINNYVEKN